MFHTVTHRMSSPLVTVLLRRVRNPVGSIPPNPPMLGPKNVSNKSNGLVCNNIIVQGSKFLDVKMHQASTISLRN